MRDRINEGLQSYWAEIFVEALKHLLPESNVQRQSPESHNDPPDALYRVVSPDGTVSHEWAELTGIYPSEDAARIVFKEARDLADRRVSSIEKLKSVSGMDDLNVARVARDAVLKKTGKSSYNSLIRDWGLGHLVLFVPYQSYPLMNRWTATAIRESLPDLSVNRYFRSVSLLYANPDYESESHVVYLSNSTAGYAFVPLWQKGK